MRQGTLTAAAGVAQKNTGFDDQGPRRRHRLARAAAAAAATIPALLATQPASADNLYWDSNGATAGSSNTTTGTWGTTNNWSIDSAGATALGTAGNPGTWTAGSTAVFSAGTNATGTTTIAVSGTQSVAGLTFEEGTINLNGGTLDFGASGTISLGRNNGTTGIANLNTTLAGGDINVVNTTSGASAVNILAAPTFTGDLNIGAGASLTANTLVQMDMSLASPTQAINLANFAAFSTTNAAGSHTINNPIRINGAEGFIAAANTRTVTYAGVISGGGNLNISLNSNGGRGTVVLGAQNTYAGDTYVNLTNNNGLLKLGVDNAFPTTTNLQFGGHSAGSNGTNVAPFDMNGHSFTVASLSSGTTGAVGGIYNTGPGTTPVTITINGSKSTTYKGVIGNTAAAAPFAAGTAFSTNISLVKNGSSTLTLTAENLHTGDTTVNGGGLVLGRQFGSIGSPTPAANTIAGNVILNNSGSTLGTAATTVSGFYSGVAGRITANGGTVISPGTDGSAGGLYAGALTLNGGTELRFDLTSPTDADRIDLAGDLTLDSGAHTIKFNGTPSAGTYTLLAYQSLNWNEVNGFILPEDVHYSWSLTGNATTPGALMLTVTDENTHIFRWDVGGGGAPATDGSGTWVSDPTGAHPAARNWLDLGPNTEAAYDNANPYDVIIGNTAAANGGTITLGSNITVGGKLTFGAIATPYTITDGGSGNTLTTSDKGIEALSSATIDANVNATVDQTWSVAGGKTLAFNKAVNGGGGSTITKTGPGTLALNGAGGSIGAFNLNAGTLSIGEMSALGGFLNVANGTTLKFTTGGTFASDITAVDATTGGQRFVWDTGANNVSLGGVIAIKGNIDKFGTGDLTLSGNNAQLVGGSGVGIMIFKDGGTVRLASSNALGSMNVQADQPLTIDVPSDSTMGALKNGSQLTKTGAGTLILANNSTAAAGNNPSMALTQGKIQLNHANGLGGGNDNAFGQMAITLSPGTELINHFAGTRNSADMVFNDNTTWTHAATAPNGNSEFTSFPGNSGNLGGASVQVNGNVTFASQSQPVVGASRDFMISMPVVVNSGATLRLYSANNTGNYDAAGLILRGVDNVNARPGDRLEVKGGATVDATTTVGEVYFGATGRGKPIVATGGGTALIKAGTHSFFRDNGSASDTTTGAAMTKLVITGGTELRFEAPMNAVYNASPEDPANPGNAPAIRGYAGTTGLLGTNTTPSANGTGLPTGYVTIGNAYTVLSPNRAAALSRTYAPGNIPAINQSGTLTLAATDAAGATGRIDVGPAAPAGVGLALDNAATSGNLVYEIDPAANGGTFANFAKLTVQRTHPSAGAVTAKLLGTTKIPGVAITGGAKIDIANQKLITNTPVGTAGAVVGNTRLYDGLQGLVQSAKNGDAWDGPGLTSSVAAAEGGLTTIGVANGAQAKGGIGETETALWGGQTITGSSILAMYTYAGDANLDGAITGDDYSAIDFGILFEGMDGYANGDFNYDGYVTGDDYSVIDLNILLQGPQIPTGGAVASASAASLSGVTAVPEPSACGFALFVAAGLLRRRRRVPVRSS